MFLCYPILRNFCPKKRRCRKNSSSVILRPISKLLVPNWPYRPSDLSYHKTVRNRIGLAPSVLEISSLFTRSAISHVQRGYVVTYGTRDTAFVCVLCYCKVHDTVGFLKISKIGGKILSQNRQISNQQKWILFSLPTM